MARARSTRARARARPVSLPGAGITDVARAARVSTATVSRVVNGNYVVAGDTRARVLEAISRLNYQPNAVARSLKKTQTKIIGFVVSDISNLHFTAMARSIEDRISGAGYNIIVCSTDGLKERESTYLTTLVGRRVDGLIVNTTGHNDAVIADLSRSLPIVLVNRRLGRGTAFRGDFVDGDNRRGARALTSHLLGLGHARIGVIAGPDNLSTGRERYRGFVEAMRAAGHRVRLDSPLKYEGDFGEQSGHDGAAALWARKPRPTALVVMNNAMALGALKYLRGAGVRVPDDVSVAAYGTIPDVELMYTQPSFVTLDPREMGVRAAELMLERLAHPTLPNREAILDTELVPGTAVRGIPRARGAAGVSPFRRGR
jgi:DNA-binding LacI/PurR family transcriptional regulator